MRFVDFAHFKIVLHVVIINILSKLLLHSYPRAVRNVVDTLVVDICLAYFALQTTTDGSWGRKVREREEGGENGGREGERKRGREG